MFYQSGYSGVSQSAKTNYVVNIGYIAVDGATTDKYIGPFQYRAPLSIVAIQDGTSNTAGILETAGGYINWGAGDPDNGWHHINYGHGFTTSGFGMCPRAGNANCDTSAQGRGLGWGIPGSAHAGNRVNTLFMDGSVRSLDSGLDQNTYVYICGAADGIVVTFD